MHDSADLDGAPVLVDEVEERLGPLEILVTNTGGPPPGPDPLGFTREQWEDAYRTLVLAPMALIERALPGMRERGFGRIVNVASSSVREPIPILMLSNVHRSGLLAGFKTLARAVAADGVTINSVLPGRIATDRLAENFGSLEAAEEVAKTTIPAGRLGTVEEFAAVAAFLCSAPGELRDGYRRPRGRRPDAEHLTSPGYAAGAQPHRLGLERQLEHLADRHDRVEAHLLAHVLGDVVEVRPVALGQDHVA